MASVITRGHLYCVLGRFEACSQREAERIRHSDGRRHTQALSRVSNKRKQAEAAESSWKRRMSTIQRTIQRAYKTELALNNKQITACRKHAGAARWAYNTNS